MTWEEIIKTNQIYPEYGYKPDSPWINIKTDLPCNHNELICSKEISEGTETAVVFAMNEYGDIWTDYMVYENGKWKWTDIEPNFWMPIPEVPK